MTKVTGRATMVAMTETLCLAQDPESPRTTSPWQAAPIFLDPIFLTWEQDAGASEVSDHQPTRRSYEMWRLAESKTGLDTVLWLNRAVNLRMRLLTQRYNMRSILRDPPPQDTEILARIGIIRPHMHRALTELHRALEVSPVPPEHCAELVDTVWYFLRSTDSLMNVQRTDMAFAHEQANRDGYVSFEFGQYFTKQSPSVAAWGILPLELVSQQATGDWISIDLKVKPRIQYGHLYFEGILSPAENHIDSVWRAFFELDHQHIG
ncbi:hypothetical protein SAMN05192558_12215 [Actinokineospora alba]|uniref:Uncharacterized protein n=2 Tax=Actinokineospora alba TaxID=504798 RepID=A0A1H0WK10_9PSEU|nr:hypothetical protein C8E96_0862 [Actinokineospora alba]SDH60894.1 hypothetical protein SAMN05421871_101683 [Actinokineospora alba]SDP90626.1 hypothetical protein SAMN05192558_12215 [Actinokineospora alba]